MALSCPGARAMELRPRPGGRSGPEGPPPPPSCASGRSRSSWSPTQAPYYQGSRLLIAADCTAYAYAAFHRQFIRGHITLVGCPKLDGVDYAEKLGEILRRNDIKSVHIVRMEVPCCGGLEQAVRQALQSSGKLIPWQVTVISTDGRVLED